MKKRLMILAAALVLSGCATAYKYNGKQYNTKEDLYAAVDSHVAQVLTTITPLPAPLSQKKLIFALPSAVAFADADKRNFVKREGKEPTDLQMQNRLDLNRADIKNIKVYFDAIKKRNIYASTQFIEMETANGAFAASTDSDALYFVIPADAGQWFYVSQKYGKQIFAWDKSGATAESKVQAFVDAAQMQAVRE